jgi:hypothetical protein
MQHFRHDLHSGSGITVESGFQLSGNSRHMIFHPLAVESRVKLLEGLVHPTFLNMRNSTGMNTFGFMT